MPNILTLDFETHDPDINDDKGAGWIPKGRGKFLGAAIKVNESEAIYTVNKLRLFDAVKDAEYIIAHNAIYELGYLKKMGIDYSNKKIVCTKLMMKLVFSAISDASLDYVAQTLLGETKDNNALGEVAILLKLCSEKTDLKTAAKVAKKNMHIMQEYAYDTVAKYACIDTDLCYKVFRKLLKRCDRTWLAYCSDMLKLLVDMRYRGIPVDTAKAELYYNEFSFIADQELHRAYEIANQTFNPDSPAQLGIVMQDLDIQLPLTEKGNVSTASEVLQAIKHPFVDSILTYRAYNKAGRDFCKRLMESGGRIHPELNPFGARTGRFSSSNPNIQQLPARHPDIGNKIRECITAEPGQNFYGLDFSSQEPRIIVHVANTLGVRSAQPLVDAYNKNPRTDIHTLVAEIAGIERKPAKTIGLGLAYGMGKPKLLKSLGVDECTAKRIYQRFEGAMPYIKESQKILEARLRKDGYIESVGGRKLYGEPGYEYKALNLMVQGSASDQTFLAMVFAYREGIKLYASVHDEIIASFETRKQAERLQEIMVSCLPMSVPFVADIGCGNNWAEAKGE